MLVLTRKPGEKIRIGADVIVEVVAMGRGGVRLGLIAPPEVVIRREELCRDPATRAPSKRRPAGKISDS